ncbi:UPF0606 protein KIAA1549L homolog isoform 2-T2 [Thomomys bottae]
MTWKLAEGTDKLQIHITPTSASLPHGKLLRVSPTWPFSEVKSSSTADRIKNGLDQSADNTSLLQVAQTLPPKAYRRTRSHVDLSSLYQGSGYSTSLDTSKDSTEPLVQPRPRGGREEAGTSGLPRTSMPLPLSTIPSAVPSSQPPVGTHTLLKTPPRSGSISLSPLPSSPALALDSSHSITFPKIVEQPTHLPLFLQTTPVVSSSGQSHSHALNPFTEHTNNTPSPDAKDFVGTPLLGFHRALTKRYSELSPTDSPHAAGSSTSEVLSSLAKLAHLFAPPPAPAHGGLHQLWGPFPSRSMLGIASSSASTQPIHPERSERAHSRGSVPTSKIAASVSLEAQPPLFQPAESVASGEPAPAAPADDSANPPLLSAVPENPSRPPFAVEPTFSLVPPSLSFTVPGQRQAILSEAAASAPWNGAEDLPSLLTVLQPEGDHASPAREPQAPILQERGNAQSPTANTDIPISSNSPSLLSTIWTFPLHQEGSVPALLGTNTKASVTVPLQVLPNLHMVNRLTSDLNSDLMASPTITTPRTTFYPSGSIPSSIPTTQAPQALPPPPGSSISKPEMATSAASESVLPASTSKQVTAFPPSTDSYAFPTMGDMRKPATTDASRSSLSGDTGTLSTTSTLSGLHQQTNYDFSGHTMKSTSWETHPAATPLPERTSAAKAMKPPNFNEMVGQSVASERSNIRDGVLGSSTDQSVQQPGVAVAGSHSELQATSHSHTSRDFQVAKTDYYPSTNQHSRLHPHLQLPIQLAHPLWLAWPSLTSAATGMQEMLSDGTDTSSEVSSDHYGSPGRNASSFQGVLGHHSVADSPLKSTSALPKIPSKGPRTSRRPPKWTGAATNAGSLFHGTQNTVGSAVSSNLEPTAAAAATTTLFLRRSSPAALSAALVAKGTNGSSLTTALAKNVTNKAAPSPKMASGTAHTAFPFTPTYMFARTAHTMNTHTAMPGNTGTASGLLSTTHLPRKPQAMYTGVPNPTKPETSRASTPRPLTITAALTSMPASVRATRLPPWPAENTDVAFPAVSTAAVTAGKVTSNLECQMSQRLLVKTVLFLMQRRMQSSDALKFSLAKGLTQALRKAFRQNDVLAHVDILEHSHNVTVGYYATKGKTVYLPAVVMDVLGVYGVSNVTADLKQHTPNLQSVAILASPWKAQPAGYSQLKTVLQFVSQSDNIQSCKFAQTMEQRLQKAFQDAERKVLSSRSNLTVQIVSTSNASQAVTLVYVVGNQSTFLNGTVASSLLSQLSAELVGFYLTYPPLTIAEPLEYPTLDISETTRDYWLITVLQGVDNSLVGLHNQSFARVMEQRLAQLFMMSQQQGRRFKRATTLGSYTVQMVKMQRVPGPKDPAELTYYTLYNGKPLLGTAAAKILSTIDSQRMALTLHHVVLLQADPVVKNPPNNLWIIAAVLAPIAVVTVIIIIITAVLCRKNKNHFKPDTMINLPQRAKPVQGFDYAKQHLGQQGADEEVIPVTQETVVLPLPVRDAPQERDTAQDGSTIKTAKSTETRKRSPSENGSVISNESGKPSSGRRSPQPQNIMAQQKVTKEEARTRNVEASDEEEGAVVFDHTAKVAADPFDTSSGSVQLITIKPSALPAVHPASDRSQESAAVLNGEVNKALKQKSDIEHYRNKLRLKAKRKGYYDFPAVETNKGGLTERKKMYEKASKEMEHVLEPDPELGAPFPEAKNRQQMKNSVYRSRQSLNSPSPGETEMDLLVTRERPRRGIRNSGYDTEPEIIEETNVDRVHEPRGYSRARQAKGHSETSTLSSQPSIDEVRQQMHMLLEEAFSLASAGHAGQGRHQEAYGSAQHLPYSEVVTSAPGTMTRPRAGVQWVPTYRPEMYQYSLPRPAYRFSQLPEMVMGSPPPPVPPRTGPVAVTSLRRSTSDIGSKTRMAESSGPEQAQLHDSASFAQVSRGPVSVAQLDQSALNYSGNTVPAVFAIPAANRPGFTGYFIPTPPSSYRNQAWMSYAGENELPSQWADSVPLPGYIEAYPRSRYQQSSPSRLPRQYSHPSNLHPSLEQAPVPSAAASQQSLAENDPPDTPLTNISTAALVKAIREEVAKLAKKQTDMFEFQV